MTNRSRWTRTAFACILALGMGAPVSLAGDRCDRRSYGRDDRAQYHYNSRGYGYGASYGGYRDSDYRNGHAESGYRDYAYRNEGYYGYGEYPQQRSAGKSAAIIGGSAAAGAAVGAMAGGGKGAAIGAAVGALGGLVYDRATKDRDRQGHW